MNLIGFIDGHFVATNRPGGDDSFVRPNMYDTDVYNGKTKTHGLKYQAVTMPIGICILDGPFGGPESDAGMQKAFLRGTRPGCCDGRMEPARPPE